MDDRAVGRNLVQAEGRLGPKVSQPGGTTQEEAASFVAEDELEPELVDVELLEPSPEEVVLEELSDDALPASDPPASDPPASDPPAAEPEVASAPWLRAPPLLADCESVE